MILIHNKNFESLVKETEVELNKIGFDTSPGSIAKLFSDIINKNISEFYDVLTMSHLQAFVTTATGKFLNAIGLLVGCKRLFEESDEDYRKRITHQTLNLAKANETSIRLAVLSIEGVKDVILKRYSHGPGSMTIVPITENIDDEGLLSSVKEVLLDITSFGEKVVVKLPNFKYLKLNIDLVFSSYIDEIEKQSIRVSVREKIISYINSINMGESLFINELTQRIMQVSDSILTYSCNSIKINNKNCLLINHDCRWDEKFIVSPDEDSVVII
ncbi:TPA: baseplate J/gp47 family protein [Clostridioides difficile]